MAEDEVAGWHHRLNGYEFECITTIVSPSTPLPSSGMRHHDQGLCLLAGHPSSFWTGGGGRDHCLGQAPWISTILLGPPTLYPSPEPSDRSCVSTAGLATLEDRAWRFLSFSPAPASSGFSHISKTNKFERLNACCSGYTHCWVQILPPRAVWPGGSHFKCSKLWFLH